MIYAVLLICVILLALSCVRYFEQLKQTQILEKIMADESQTEQDVDKLGTDVTTLLTGVQSAITTLAAQSQAIADLKAHPATDDTAVQNKLTAIDTAIQNAMGQLTAALPQPT